MLEILGCILIGFLVVLITLVTFCTIALIIAGTVSVIRWAK